MELPRPSDEGRRRGNVAKSIILKKYDFGEADELVVFLSRELGWLRGVAKNAKKSRNEEIAGMLKEPGILPSRCGLTTDITGPTAAGCWVRAREAGGVDGMVRRVIHRNLTPRKPSCCPNYKHRVPIPPGLAGA